VDAEAAGAKAQALGVPMISLAVSPTQTALPYVFHAVHSPNARIRALIERARAQGATSERSSPPIAPTGNA